MNKNIFSALILITVSCTKQTDQGVGFFHGLNWQAVVILIVIFILIFQLPKFIWIAQQRKNKNQLPQPQQSINLMSSINFSTVNGLFKSLFTTIGKIFSMKIFRLPFVLLVLLLSLMVINYIDHSDTKKTNNPEEQSYIPEKGFMGNLWEVLLGKKESENEEKNNSSTPETYNSQQINPNIQYEWDRKYEIEKEKNRHEEEMAKIQKSSSSVSSSYDNTSKENKKPKEPLVIIETYSTSNQKVPQNQLLQ